MKPSQFRNSATASATALASVIALATQNNYGEKEPYNLQQGVREFSRDFLSKNKPFGYYKLKGEDVFFVNEPMLTDEEKELFKQISTTRTDVPGIFAVKKGKVSTLRDEPESVRDTYRTENGD